MKNPDNEDMMWQWQRLNRAVTKMDAIYRKYQEVRDRELFWYRVATGLFLLELIFLAAPLVLRLVGAWGDIVMGLQ